VAEICDREKGDVALMAMVRPTRVPLNLSVEIDGCNQL
jgi:hypothetical protein